MVDENIDGKKTEDILQACYKAIDAETEAISQGKMGLALKYQDQLKKYKQLLPVEYKDLTTNYKREKFAQLEKTREQVDGQKESWKNKMKGMYKIKDVTIRKEAMRIISNTQNKEQEKEDKETEPEQTEEVVI